MILKRISVLLYVTIVIFLGAFILLFALNIINFNHFLTLSYASYYDHDLRVISGVIASIILLSNFLFYRFFSVNVHRDKIIAFDNPSGRVSVSLMAMEDLVRRLVTRLNDVRDARVKITARKKGLDVKVRLTIKSEVHIPETTSKVQDKIKRKIQDMIGLEEPVDVSIYVGRILSDRAGKDGDEPEKEETPPVPVVPFRGYRS